MCWYKTSSSLNPTVSSQAAHLLLGHFALRSSATSQLQLKGRETNTHLVIYLLSNTDPPTQRQTHTAEANTHTHAYTYCAFTLHVCKWSNLKRNIHSNRHTHSTHYCTTTHTRTHRVERQDPMFPQSLSLVCLY